MKDPKETEMVRLNFDFPRNYYAYLKMLCTQKGITLKDFATRLLIQAIEDEEDAQLAKEAIHRLETTKEEDFIPWKKARRLIGLQDEDDQDSQG